MSFLLTTDQKVAEDFARKLDQACGYPNPPTLTERAVNVQVMDDGSFLVSIPDGVWAPKLQEGFDAKEILPPDRKDETPLDTDADVINKKKQLEADGKLSKTPPPGDVQNFVTVSALYVDSKQSGTKTEASVSDAGGK